MSTDNNCHLHQELAMLSIDVIPTCAYADLGEAWVRYQSARIEQRYLQLGRHFPLDLNALLRRLAIAVRATRMIEPLEPRGPASTDHTRPASIEAVGHCVEAACGS
jgi:hypothetical protein